MITSYEEFLQLIEAGNLSKLKELDIPKEYLLPQEREVSALYAAIKFHQRDIAKYLLVKGADPTLMGNEGWPPIFVAVIEDHKDIFKLFLRNDNLLDLCSGKKGGYWKPLHLAVQKNSIDCLDYLLKRGANPNCEDGSQNTPLHYAVRNKQILSVQSLLKAGASIDIPNNDGKTAMQLAIEGKNEQILNLINTTIEMREKNNFEIEHYRENYLSIQNEVKHHSVEISRLTEKNRQQENEIKQLKARLVLLEKQLEAAEKNVTSQEQNDTHFKNYESISFFNSLSEPVVNVSEEQNLKRPKTVSDYLSKFGSVAKIK